MSSILVTGAGGFIGRHLVAALAAMGEEVRAFVHHPDQRIDQAHTLYGDIGDVEAVRKATDGVAVIYHLAAQVSNSDSIAHPAETFAVNVNGTLNVLEAASQSPQPVRVVIVSTADVYGTPRCSPIDELHPLQARTPYAASKIAAEALALSFYYSRGTAVSVVRLFNTYGIGQDQRALIPTIIHQALTQPIVELGSLTPVRDWLYVGDAVAGLIAAGTQDAAIGETIHLGSGSALSVGELAQRTLDLIGSTARIVSREDRARMSESAALMLCANTAKAAALLNWQPRTSLDQGLRLTIESMREVKH